MSRAPEHLGMFLGRASLQNTGLDGPKCSVRSKELGIFPESSSERSRTTLLLRRRMLQPI